MRDQDNTMTKLVTFRCQEPLASALQKAADKRYCSISVVAREATAAFLRNCGLLEESKP
jgi:predicted transcriptional regulator